MNWQRVSTRDFKQLQAESDSELISQTWSTFSLNINVTSCLSVSNNVVWILDFMNLRNWRERHWKWASLSVRTSLTTRVLWRDGGCSDVWFKGSSSVRESELLLLLQTDSINSAGPDSPAAFFLCLQLHSHIFMSYKEQLCLVLKRPIITCQIISSHMFKLSAWYQEEKQSPVTAVFLLQQPDDSFLFLDVTVAWNKSVAPDVPQTEGRNKQKVHEELNICSSSTRLPQTLRESFRTVWCHRP